MNRLKKEIAYQPKKCARVDRLRDYADSIGVDRSKHSTGIDGNGYSNSRLRLYASIINHVK